MYKRVVKYRNELRAHVRQRADAHDSKAQSCRKLGRRCSEKARCLLDFDGELQYAAGKLANLEGAVRAEANVDWAARLGAAAWKCDSAKCAGELAAAHRSLEDVRTSRDQLLQEAAATNRELMARKSPDGSIAQVGTQEMQRQLELAQVDIRHFQSIARTAAAKMLDQLEGVRQGALITRAQEKGRHCRERRRLNGEKKVFLEGCSAAKGRISQVEADKGKASIEPIAGLKQCDDAQERPTHVKNEPRAPRSQKPRVVE